MHDGGGKEGNLSDTIYHDLVEAIGNGAFAMGDRLPPENVLKERYGVSRNTIRLVLNRLCALGIVETRRGDGSFVRKVGANVALNMVAPTLLFEKHDLAHLLELRKAVEVYAVRLAAERATDADIAKMRANLKQMQRSMGDMGKFERADMEMHLNVARATGNEMFSSILEIVHQVLKKEMASLFVRQGHDIDSYFYHNAIFECITKQKPDEAAYMMEKHLSLVIERAEAGKIPRRDRKYFSVSI